MDQFLLAFVTGLTTGGLSCLAVQGGLLATSLGRQLEQDLSSRTRKGKPGMALPILLFLGAKLLAYTLLGFLLGALGSVFQLSTFTRALLLVAIGVFMLGNALRMLNVHPIFRYFVITPPKVLTRAIRRTAASEAALTPLFLGALTVLIPCGVTQAMMAVALATADPAQAAGLMFAFTLGTSPVFFLVSYLATRIGERLERWFMRAVAVLVLIIGLVSVDNGITLMGFPYSLTNLVQSAAAGQTVPPGAAQAEITLNAGNGGYTPRRLLALADVPVRLNVVTRETYSCARDFVIPDLGVEVLLPETGTVPIDIPPQKAGTRMPFTCSMGMYTGVIEFGR